jgi:hypothetical protein
MPFPFFAARRRHCWLAAALPLALTLSLGGAVRAQDAAPAPLPAPIAPDPNEKLDDAALAKIRDEGLNRSQVMATLSYLTDVIGPRLTGSPGLKRANEWTAAKLTEWGLANAHLEPWGPFGRGWTLKRFSAEVVAPLDFPLIAYPKAWSPGVKGGQVTADVVYIGDADPAALEKMKGQLKGKIVLVSPVRQIAAQFTAPGARYTDDELAKIAVARPAPRRPRGAGGGPGGPPPAAANDPAAAERQRQFAEALRTRQAALARSLVATQEGAAVIVDSARGDGGTLFVQQASVPQPADTPPDKRVSPWSKDAEKLMVPQVSLGAEHYNRLVRMLQAGEKVKVSVALGVESKVYDNGNVFNTVAEIPGSDLKDEIVMCGAHIDSWHSGTGATDNGAGVAVCMEAVRILQAAGLKPRRTIRVALWSGEEQGLYGSEAYVAQHFGKRERGVLTPGPEHGKLSAYFNLDNGTGKIRGVWGENNADILPVFARWLEPFNDLGATTVTLRTTGGTDHQSFDAVGLPAFQFIQDTVEYDTRTHHSNMDVFDRIQGDDMKQAATVMAAFLYNAANRDAKLPRKPAPAPAPVASAAP